MYKFKKKQEKGITLIALVITIILLLIFAGISINMLTGNNSLLNKSVKAKDEHEYAKIKELIKLKLNDEAIELQTKNKIESTRVLWDSPFQYQLIKSTEEENIKSRLGREIEATDLFYEVNLSAIGIEEVENVTYIYDKSADVLAKVNKNNLQRSNGVWYWTESEIPEIYQYFIEDTKRIEMFDFLENEGVTEIYLSFGNEYLTTYKEKLKEIVAEAYERGMVVEYLTGDPNYIMPSGHESHAIKRIDDVVEYNNECEYNQKLRGIHYDVEAHTNFVIEGMNSWKNSNSEENKNDARKINFVKFLEKAYTYSRNKNITVSFDEPPKIYCSNIVNYNGEECSLMEYIVKYSDYISLMAYRNDVVGLWRYVCLPFETEYSKSNGRITYTSNLKSFSDGTLRSTDSVHALALKYSKNIMIGLEIGDADEEDDDDLFVNLGKNKMKEVITDFTNLLGNADEDIVTGSRSLKDQSTEKCGYTNVDFDHFGFMFHKHTQYFNLED